MKKHIAYIIIIALVLYGVLNPPERIPGDILDTRLNELSVYGELTDIEEEDGGVTKVYIDQEMYNCRKNNSVVVIYGKIPPLAAADLEIGSKYMVVFKRVNQDYEWQGGIDPLGIGYCDR